MRQARWWRWWLAGGALAIVGYFLLPEGGTVASVLYDVIGLASGLAILFAVRLHRATRPAMWYWFAGGQIMSVLGDITYSFVENVLHEPPYPSVADIFYLGSYPVTFTGLVLLIRRSRGRTLAGLLDAAIVATGLGLAFWIFVLHPIAAGSVTSPLERAVDITYPTVDLLLLAGLARLFTDPGNRTPAPGCSAWPPPWSSSPTSRSRSSRCTPTPTVTPPTPASCCRTSSGRPPHCTRR